jgi:exopolyphosphatase / guanosine-5'-triphosphate,3'-diphosphate pyrophosphatase
MQKAIIDLGTNTFHLLIAEIYKQRIEVIYKHNIAVKLGKGGINNGFITDEALKRAFDALAIFKSKIEAYNCKNILATGTSALRNAKNGNDFVAKIRNELHIEIQIIDGNTEALFIYNGVKNAVDLGTEKSLIVDIGGGSVEMLIANSHEVFWKKSFEIGGQRLLDKFKPSDPITNTEIDTIEHYLESQLKSLFEAINNHKPTQLVGSSGSFDTFMDMFYANKNETTPNKTSFTLPFSDYQNIADSIIKTPLAQRRKLPGMIELRVEMIVVATILVGFLLRKTEIKTILVSTYALKEGVLFSDFKTYN